MAFRSGVLHARTHGPLEGEHSVGCGVAQYNHGEVHWYFRAQGMNDGDRLGRVINSLNPSIVSVL